MPALPGHPVPVTPTTAPAGTIATRTAGCAEFRATLSWAQPGGVPPEPALPDLRGPFLLSLAETDDQEAATRAIYGEIRALSDAALRCGLEAVLRAVTAHAALTEAVLETRAAYRSRPAAAPSGALQALARDLWEAGFPVGFGACWEDVPEPGVGLGARGAEEELAAFVRAHPSWRPA